MQREHARASPHEQIAGALARAARVHDKSRALIEESLRVSIVVRETAEAMHRRQEMRAAVQPDKSALRNGQRDARRHSQRG